jgi:hypothetical protein
VTGTLKIDNLDVHIDDGLYYPELVNYGHMIETVDHFQYQFQKGKSYGIIGQCGEGGWGLSYAIAGRAEHSADEIKVNGKAVTPEQLAGISWYVGDGMPKRGPFPKSRTVLNQISAACRMNTDNKRGSVEEIIALFNLSQDRLELPLDNQSWEKWRSSIAIGYAYGAQIFCFPWVSTGWVNDLILNCGIHICIDILKNVGAIVILPTQTAESVDFFLDEIVPLQGSRHLPSS